jgi:hypothetical protein
VIVHTDHSFEFTARAPLRAVFPLFGGWGERAWAGESWQPRFLHPDPPRDEDGEVFTTRDAVWVNTAFDIEAGRVQYVYIAPEVQAVRTDLSLQESAGETRVRVRYRRTALRPDANDVVEQRGRSDAAAGREWADAVNATLRKGAA